MSRCTIWTSLCQYARYVYDNRRLQSLNNKNNLIYNALFMLRLCQGYLKTQDYFEIQDNLEIQDYFEIQDDFES
jgi:hypothetical protein